MKGCQAFLVLLIRVQGLGFKAVRYHLWLEVLNYLHLVVFISATSLEGSVFAWEFVHIVQT